MHKRSKLSLRQRFALRFREELYCGCKHCIRCGCGQWEKHHSDKKYITPLVVRPFDGIRHHFEKLVNSIKFTLAI